MPDEESYSNFLVLLVVSESGLFGCHASNDMGHHQDRMLEDAATWLEKAGEVLAMNPRSAAQMALRAQALAEMAPWPPGMDTTSRRGFQWLPDAVGDVGVFKILGSHRPRLQELGRQLIGSGHPRQVLKVHKPAPCYSLRRCPSIKAGCVTVEP